MEILYILAILFFICGIILKLSKNREKTTNNENKFIKYEGKQYVMTETELKFYRFMKDEFKKQNINVEVFPEVDLERFIRVKDNNNSNRNRIKSRSIDFTIVSKSNCKIICCIELDDYTHNRSDRMQRDEFINQLFKAVDIKLFRIKVASKYNIDEIINTIKEVVH